MRFYRCDLCGSEQSMSEPVQFTMDNPTGSLPIGLPIDLEREDALPSELVDVQEICMVCHEKISEIGNAIYRKAKKEAAVAMADYAVKLKREPPAIPHRDEGLSEYLMRHENDIHHAINDFGDLHQTFYEQFGRPARAGVHGKS